MPIQKSLTDYQIVLQRTKLNIGRQSWGYFKPRSQYSKEITLDSYEFTSCTTKIKNNGPHSNCRWNNTNPLNSYPRKSLDKSKKTSYWEHENREQYYKYVDLVDSKRIEEEEIRIEY